jgi:hypothetical protein
MNLVEAIYKLNPMVVTTRGDVAYDANEQVVTYDLSAAQALMDSKAYQELRASAYPSMQDQLDMQYWDGVNGTTTWQDAIEAVKTGNPKP